MTLAALQAAFFAQILDEERPLAPAWAQAPDDGMARGLSVYRNAYRTRLVEALRQTFPKTVALAGQGAFDAAAAHYLIAAPPRGWTLDLIGADFPALLHTLFANDSEVAEVAALEWAMHVAFTAADEAPLSLEEFAACTAVFGERDWAAMTLDFLPGLSVLEARFDCAPLWQGAGEEHQPRIAALDAGERARLVWRSEDWRPVFCLVPAREAACVAAMRGGAAFGEMCERLAADMPDDEAAAAAGGMLQGWLHRGLVSGVAAKSSPAAPRL